eukprot:13334183-Alexandrium_andersonii.AAC.1
MSEAVREASLSPTTFSGRSAPPSRPCSRAPSGRSDHSRSRRSRRSGGQAVSYTHLTLPTICSV